MVENFGRTIFFECLVEGLTSSNFESELEDGVESVRVIAAFRAFYLLKILERKRGRKEGK